jgi:hypothetical protein
MKYILLMSGTQAGASGYRTWSQSDRDVHMQTVGAVLKELVETGEFVATQAFSEPKEAKVVRGEKNGVPVTDGIFPESKEFLLGYWIVDRPLPSALTPLRAGFLRRPDREAFRRICRSKCGRSRISAPPRTDAAANGTLRRLNAQTAAMHKSLANDPEYRRTRTKSHRTELT